MAAWRYSGGTLSEPGEAEYVLRLRDLVRPVFRPRRSPRARARLSARRRPARRGARGHHRLQLVAAPVRREHGGDRHADWFSTESAYTVVGIAPAGFRLDGEEADVFTPLGQNTSPGHAESRARIPAFGVLARLRPGATLAQAQAELALIGRRLAEQYPETNAGPRLRGGAASSGMWAMSRSTLWLLLGAVGLVLLIACVNVASLLLARAVSRERELAMRVALGAGRGRLVRQCLTESAVLGLSGGVLGRGAGGRWHPPVCGVLAGQFAARRGGPARLARAAVCARPSRLRAAFFSGWRPPCALLRANWSRSSAPARGPWPEARAACTADLWCPRSPWRWCCWSPPGCSAARCCGSPRWTRASNIRNVLVTRMALSPGHAREPRPDPRGLAGHAGSRTRAYRECSPCHDGRYRPDARRQQPARLLDPAGSAAGEAQQPLALATSVTPDYLKVMGIPLRQGRFFDDQDRMGSEAVVVIDEVMAQQAFGGQEPSGSISGSGYVGSGLAI